MAGIFAWRGVACGADTGMFKGGIPYSLRGESPPSLLRANG